MPFSSVLGASSVIKPGVCTSTTRPTVPYEGQLIYETDTDRVAAYNGSAWVYGFTGGMSIIKPETSFSAATSVDVDSAFSSSFTNYKLVVNYTTTASGIRIRFRAGGSTVSTSTYNEQQMYGDNATTTSSRGANGGSIIVGNSSSGSFNSSFECMIYNPNVATPTTVMSTNICSFTAYTAPIVLIHGGNQTGATSYDGFNLFTGSGTMTGTYTLYGLAKA